jgi:hypothetical protein
MDMCESWSTYTCLCHPSGLSTRGQKKEKPEICPVEICILRERAISDHGHLPPNTAAPDLATGRVFEASHIERIYQTLLQEIERFMYSVALLKRYLCLSTSYLSGHGER